MTGGRPVRLLWLFDSLGAGGAESLTIPFVRSVDHSKFHLTVASLSGAHGVNAERLRAEGIAVIDLGARNLRDVRAFRRLLRLLRDEEIDLIHSHLTYSSIWSALATRLTGVRSVSSLHVAPSATRALQNSARHHIAVELRDRLMIAALNRWATGVIAVSAALRDEYVGRRLDARKTRVVHNGIELERFSRPYAEARARLVAELGIAHDARVAVTVSVLRPAKGIEVLLEAARSVPDATFLIIGDGPLRDEWTAMAERLGVASRVVWAGYRTDVDALLAGCELFVHPTLDDAFPTVLLEAMAAGLPVIASDVGGISEIVDDDLTGILLPAGEAAALAEALRSLLADPVTRSRMGDEARARTSRFSTRSWMERLTAVYSELPTKTRRHGAEITVHT